jgi:hypothetical protein
MKLINVPTHSELFALSTPGNCDVRLLRSDGRRRWKQRRHLRLLTATNFVQLVNANSNDPKTNTELLITNESYIVVVI